METTFSMTRVQHIMRRDLIENWKSNLYGLLGIFAACFFPMLGFLWSAEHWTEEGYPEVYSFERFCGNMLGIIGMVVSVAMIYYASRIMKCMNTKGMLPEDLCHELGISQEDLMAYYTEESVYNMPLTEKAKAALLARKDLVTAIENVPDDDAGGLYPDNKLTGWTVDNYGPIWIPKKGATIDLTLDNLPMYERPIKNYEGNSLEVKDGKIYINGQETTKYTFKMDYYWMMGDNRHNSADSRFWGFVPEDHIVGKPIFIWLSLNQDRGWFDGKIRWNRLFKFVDSIK